jgi:hypothetical protein
VTAAVVTVIIALFLVLTWGHYGWGSRSVGRRLFGLRVVNVKTGQAAGRFAAWFAIYAYSAGCAASSSWCCSRGLTSGGLAICWRARGSSRSPLMPTPAAGWGFERALSWPS